MSLTLSDEDSVRSVSPGGSSVEKRLVTRSKISSAYTSETEDSHSEVDILHKRKLSAIESRDMAPAASISLNSPPKLMPLGAREWDLARRLELTRRDSQNQHGSEQIRRKREILQEMARGAGETMFRGRPPVSPHYNLNSPTDTPRGPRSSHNPYSSDDETANIGVEGQLGRPRTEISDHDAQSSSHKSHARRNRMLMGMKMEETGTEGSDVGHMLRGGHRSRSLSSMAASRSAVGSPLTGLTRSASTDRLQPDKAAQPLSFSHERLLVLSETTRKDASYFSGSVRTSTLTLLLIDPIIPPRRKPRQAAARAA